MGHGSVFVWVSGSWACDPLFTVPRACRGTTCSSSTQLLCLLRALWLSFSGDAAIRYVLPVLWMTSCLNVTFLQLNCAYILQFGVVGYHLYVILYSASMSPNVSANLRRDIVSHVTERTNQLAARGCNVTFGAKNIRDIAARSRDAHDVNLAMMDAYLDDGVDYFLLMYPHIRVDSAADLQQLPSRSRTCIISPHVHCINAIYAIIISRVLQSL